MFVKFGWKDSSGQPVPRALFPAPGSPFDHLRAPGPPHVRKAVPLSYHDHESMPIVMLLNRVTSVIPRVVTPPMAIFAAPVDKEDVEI